MGEKKENNVLFLIMGTSRICFVNFPVYHRAVVTTVITLCIPSLALIHHITGGL